jgi:hypothetical protein
VEFDGHLVAAQWIHPLGGNGRVGQWIPVARAPVVIKDHFSVKIFEGHSDSKQPCGLF